MIKFKMTKVLGSKELRTLNVWSDIEGIWVKIRVFDERDSKKVLKLYQAVGAMTDGMDF